MTDQYVPSITLRDLISSLEQWGRDHPEDLDKQVYHDCLHLTGEVSPVNETIIELL